MRETSLTKVVQPPFHLSPIKEKGISHGKYPTTMATTAKSAFHSNQVMR
jgi:hypothetical protein